MSGRLREKWQGQNKAVAVSYRPESDNAPKVIASGKGAIAQRIIDIAKENHIHIHDDPDLVEVLSKLDLNEEIPTDLYIVVSELLAFVYALNRKDLTHGE
jgi:flagellar biosynthesis protein